jgi:hypothetical protein
LRLGSRKKFHQLLIQFGIQIKTKEFLQQFLRDMKSS